MSSTRLKALHRDSAFQCGWLLLDFTEKEKKIHLTKPNEVLILKSV